MNPDFRDTLHMERLRKDKSNSVPAVIKVDNAMDWV